MKRRTCTSSVQSMAVSVTTSSLNFWLYIYYISFSILSMWRWLRDWHLFFWDLYFGGEMPTKHDLAAPYSTEMWQVPYEIILKLLQMAVLEIQGNGDSAVSKEAIANAGQSLEDPLMRVRVQGWVMFNRHDRCFSKCNQTHDFHLADDKTGKQTQQHRLTFKEEPILDLQ